MKNKLDSKNKENEDDNLSPDDQETDSYEEDEKTELEIVPQELIPQGTAPQEIFIKQEIIDNSITQEVLERQSSEYIAEEEINDLFCEDEHTATNNSCKMKVNLFGRKKIKTEIIDDSDTYSIHSEHSDYISNEHDSENIKMKTEKVEETKDTSTLNENCDKIIVKCETDDTEFETAGDKENNTIIGELVEENNNTKKEVCDKILGQNILINLNNNLMASRGRAFRVKFM